MKVVAMNNYILSVKNPVRIAKQKDQYLLYNTRNFECIYLDNNAFMAWQYIQSKREISQQQLINYVLEKCDSKKHSENDLMQDCSKLIEFLYQKDFIERK